MNEGSYICPFCEGRYARRYMHIHVESCIKREKYFQKMLEPLEMEEIKRRVNGNTWKTENVKTNTFEGKAHGRNDF